MAVIFTDLDGSLFFWGTEKPVPGALEELLRFKSAGNQIIFTTQRQPNDPSFDMINLFKFMNANFPDATILYGVTSPRIVINDAGAFAINHPKNSPWNYDLLEIANEHG